MARVAIKSVLLVATATACPLMVLLLFLARRGGRRTRFWRARRPGAVASLAGTIVLFAEVAHQAIRPTAAVHVIRFVTRSWGPHARYMGWDLGPFNSLGNWTAMEDPFATALLGMSRHAGLVIGGAWLALILANAWRPDPTWVDRAGRIVGAFWIVSACHFFLLPI
jgi:hypothetical protein